MQALQFYYQRGVLKFHEEIKIVDDGTRFDDGIRTCSMW